MTWTLTKDKLPEKDGDYLVTIPLANTAYVHILGFSNGRFLGDYNNVIAWIPCPEPYKENE